MRFLFAPQIIDMKVHSKASNLEMQALQCLSKAYSSITFGKMFNENTEYGLELINDHICGFNDDLIMKIEEFVFEKIRYIDLKSYKH